jgi:G6PDH family F420-dependent oxidoreductase
LEIIRLLWSGGYHSYEGKHLQLEDARVFDLPETLPPIVVAGSGAESATIAAELGDGLFAVAPDADLVEAYHAAGGKGPRYGEVALAWAADEERAVQAALETSRWAVTGWKVMSELPNPVNFEAAAQTVTADDIRAAFAVGPAVDTHVAAVQRYVEAGFDHLVLMNAGPDPDGFLDFYASELGPRLRAITG